MYIWLPRGKWLFRASWPHKFPLVSACFYVLAKYSALHAIPLTLDVSGLSSLSAMCFQHFAVSDVAHSCKSNYLLCFFKGKAIQSIYICRKRSSWRGPAPRGGWFCAGLGAVEAVLGELMSPSPWQPSHSVQCLYYSHQSVFQIIFHRHSRLNFRHYHDRTG